MCGGPDLNAYKKKLNRSLTEASNDEFQQLDTWYSQVVDGSDLRDRVAVTGFNISRGVFGSISLDGNCADDCKGTAIFGDCSHLTK